MSSRTLQRRLYLWVALLFSLGVVIGASVMRVIDNKRLLSLFQQGPVQTRRELLLLELEQRLALTASQRQEISTILDAQVKENTPVLRTVFMPLMKNSWSNLATRVKPLLQEHQQELLQVWIKERQYMIEKSLVE